MASRNLGTLTIDLVAQIAGFVAGMDKAAKAAEERSARIEASFKNAARAVEGALAAFGVEKFLRSVFEASAAQEDALLQLETRLKSTGGVAGKTAEDLVALSKALQATTVYSHTAALGAETLLLSFQNVRGEVFDRAIKGAADLAAALGEDLPEAVRKIGFALNNPVQGLARLTRAGISLDASQRTLIKRLAETGDIVGAQTAILDALEKAYGGASTAAANTFSGALKQLKNSFDDLLEAPDGSLIAATKALQDLRTFLTDPATIEAAGAFTAALVDGFKAATGAVIGFLDFTGNVLSTKQDSFIQQQKAKVKELQDSLAIQKERGPYSGGIFGALFGIGKESTEDFLARMDETKALLVDAEKRLEIFQAAVDRSRSGTPFGVGTLPKAAPPPASSGVVAIPESADYQKLAAAYREQLAAVGELTEGQKLRFKIESGELKTITPQEIEMAKILAANVDAHVEAEKVLKKQAEAQKKLNDEYENEREHLLEQSQIIGKVTELDKTRFDITYGKLKDISAARKTELLDLAAEANANDLIAKEQEKQKEAAKKQAEETKVFFDQAKRNIQDIFSQSLVDAFEGKKTDILKSFGDMLLKMAAQAASAHLLDALFNSIGTATAGASGGFLGALKSFFTPSPRASGGPVSAGSMYKVGEHGTEWIVAPADGYVIPHGGGGSAGGGVVVNVINAPSQPQVSESRGADGTRQIQILFDNMFKQSLGDGRFDGALRGRYGVRPAVGGGR